MSDLSLPSRPLQLPRIHLLSEMHDGICQGAPTHPILPRGPVITQPSSEVPPERGALGLCHVEGARVRQVARSTLLAVHTAMEFRQVFIGNAAPNVKAVHCPEVGGETEV